MARWGDKILAQHLANQAARAAAPAAALAKPAKYRSSKVRRGEQTFDSEKEVRRWDTLNIMQTAGKISELQRQVRFVLAPAVRLTGEPRAKPALRYFADFTYIQDGQLVVEDVKSAPTRKLASYRNKKHLMATVHNIHIQEV